MNQMTRRPIVHIDQGDLIGVPLDGALAWRGI